MGLEYRIGNRKVSKSEWERNLSKQVEKAAADAVEKRLRTGRCPIHGSSPQGLRRVMKGSKMEWQFSMCCEDGKAAVLRRLS